jgi:superfamily I DNA/RNA helicase
MRKVLILGVPGSGKTERLLKKMDYALEAGTRPDRIAFASFTRVAVEEARARACDAFGLTPDDLPHFRTVHSFAFRELGLRREDVLSDEHLERVSDLTGELITSLENPFSDAPAIGRAADPMLTIDHYARTTGRDLATAWRDHGSDLEWHRLLRFARAYAAYKEDEGVIDFTDMLTRYADSALPPLEIDLGIVDEAQDLSRAQWRAILRAFGAAEELYVGGDDMQMIHHWAGADEERFLGLAAEGFEVENLSVAHRLPRAAFPLADEVGRRIGRRYERPWRPSDREGSLDWVAGASDVDLSGDGLGGKKRWLVLARTRAQLPALAAAARDQGVIYTLKGESSVKWNDVRAIRAHEALRAGKGIASDEATVLGVAAGRDFDAYEGERDARALGYDASEIWHDALRAVPIDRREYYLAILRRGAKLTDESRVRIDTIHGSKGAEAEGVVLSTDMTYRTSRAMELDPDSENRVFYVGLTRVIQRMFCVAPATAYGYRI